jgi:hypothetical protein
MPSRWSEVKAPLAKVTPSPAPLFSTKMSSTRRSKLPVACPLVFALLSNITLVLQVLA